MLYESFGLVPVADGSLKAVVNMGIGTIVAYYDNVAVRVNRLRRLSFLFATAINHSFLTKDVFHNNNIMVTPPGSPEIYPSISLNLLSGKSWTLGYYRWF